MRLIDADALLESYDLKDATKYGNKDAKQQRHSYDTMMMYEIADMIENAPTAYDVDKVVEQLSCEKCSACLLEENCTANFGDGFMEKIREIVKAGGVNG